MKDLSGYRKPKQPLGSGTRWEQEFVQSAGVREVLVISTPHDTPRFEQLLGDGIGVGVVLQPDGNTEALCNEIAERHVVPAIAVAADADGPVVVDDAGHGDADAEAARIAQQMRVAAERIEAAASARSSAAGDPELQRRYGALRDEAGAALAELDRLIGTLGQ